MKKTIFKRPLFVNPQAYTTIPELYSIDKLQSFNFDENDTYTTKLVYNGRVESIIKKAGEEHILHLDLYTVDGSCVLGEWYVKGIDSESVVTIDKNILTIVANNNLKYPGLIAAWSAKGKTNEDADRNVLKDLTGNGHDITLSNFAYSGMSGYGGCNYGKTEYHLTSTSWYETILSKTPVNGRLSFNIRGITELYEKVRQRIEVREYRYDNSINYIGIEQDGDYDIEIDENIFSHISMNFGGEELSDYPCNVIIKMELNYPDALVFDGVNDLGVNRSIPSLTDYTIIIKKKAFERNGIVCATNGNFNEVAFIIDDRIAFPEDETKARSNSFSYESLVTWVDNISYQTKNSYNGETIKVGKLVTTSGFNISSYGGMYWKGAFYSAYLFDRSLDEQEIKSFIRKHIDPEYLLPSEIPAITLISNDTLIDNSTLIKNN